MDADAQAVLTNSATVKPLANTFSFKKVKSASSTNLCVTAGIGSCHTNSSVGTSAPTYLERGPISRCVNLNQALAKASAN